MNAKSVINKISLNVSVISNVLLGSIVLTNKGFLKPPVVFLGFSSVVSTVVLVKTRSDMKNNS